MPRSLLLTLLLACALSVPVSLAVAADPMPTPDCHGQQVKDAAGDNQYAPPAGPGQQGSPSTDITGGWVTYDPATQKAQANIQIANLTEGEIDPGYDGVSWEFAFTSGQAWYVRAFTDLSGTTVYRYGQPKAVTDDQTAAVKTGDTTGKMFPGANGVIQIDIPLKDMSIKPGDSLKAIAIEVRQWVTKPASVPSPPGVPLYSYAPIYDQGAGKGAVVLGPCAAPAPGATATPAPGTTTGTTGTTPSQSSGSATLELKVTAPKIVAKKANKPKVKKKGLVFKLSGTASNIVAALKTGTNPMTGKVVAKGKLASVKGSGKLKLKITRKLKKGTYTLFMTGKNADGRNAEGALTVKVK